MTATGIISRAVAYMGVSRRFLVLLSGAVLLLAAAAFALLRSNVEDLERTYTLMNVNLVLLLALGTLIAQQIVRLWKGRKKGIAGSRLHIRLVTVLSFLTATPAVLMAVFASVFFYFGIQAWFNEKVSTAVNESLAVAQAYLQEHQQVMRADVLAMASDFERDAALLLGNEAALNQVIQTQSQLRNLSEAIIFKSDGSVMARTRLSFALEFDKPPRAAFEKARTGEVVLLKSSNHDRIRALVRLDRFADTYLYVGRLVDADVVEHVQTTESAVREYAQLESKRGQFQSSTMLLFVAVTLILLLVSIWVGLLFARQMVTPLSALIQAAERVRVGDLTARVEEAGQRDEIATLGRAFNRMTTQLAEQRDELLSANHMLEDRRRFMEAVLAGTSSGIIGLDGEGKVTLANLKAAELLQVESRELIGKKLADILPEIAGLINTAGEIQINYQSVKGGFVQTLLVRVTIEEGGLAEGAVVTFDDISALVSAQRKAAWADVARRIAHEIKNPLTPIQLSAERLKRKYLPQIKEDPDTFSHCTDTIVRQVTDIGRMVTEFSSFARMPEAIKQDENVSDLCRETLVLQKQAHTGIDFALDVPVNAHADIDRSQINQVLTNLIQNGIDAIEERQAENPGQGHIVLRMTQTPQDISITVEDDGTGLPDKDRERLTEPYVTTRKKGTGLGLAIVKKILEDHHGSLLMEDVIHDGVKSGAKITIVIPKHAEQALRKASGG